MPMKGTKDEASRFIYLTKTHRCEGQWADPPSALFSLLSCAVSVSFAVSTGLQQGRGHRRERELPAATQYTPGTRPRPALPAGHL